MPLITSSQIGKCGEILVQFRLLKLGIESAPMTTDAGIDLVAYIPSTKTAVTIQVKTNFRPKPAGGKGGDILDWWLAKNSPAQLIALANLQSDEVWLFRHEDFFAKAQQTPKPGIQSRLYFYTDSAYEATAGRHERDFEEFRIENKVGPYFGITA
jgi:hypothetical protein